MAAAGAGRFIDALAAIDTALALAPERADYHAQRARCLAMLKRDADALEAARRALALGPGDALTLDTIGVVLARLEAHEQAAAAFRHAVELAPDKPDYRFNLASALRYCGDFDGAEAGYEQAVRLSPRFYRAHAALAELGRHTRERNHIERLSRLLEGVGADVDGALRVRYALAREHEDLGEYEAAFAHLEAGKTAKRATLGYSFAEDRRLFESVQRVCDESFFERAGAAAEAAGAAGLTGDSGAAGPAETGATAAAGNRPDDAPIFVIGMPRTGTTLIERILSSHSKVSSAGELQAFGLCVKRAAGTPTRRVLDPETIEAAAAVDLGAAGEAYLAAAAAVTGGACRFVDKMPLNSFYVGLIHAALPAAKFVCLRRDPLDTCISSFRQLFALGFRYYDYTYDLADIARYYACFDRLIDHWQRMLPGRLLQVRYENLIADPLGQIGNLLEFCGLRWEQQCVSFHVNPSPVATASAVQVRRPLHGESIGRWRHYREQLGEACRLLQAAGVPLSADAPVGGA